MLISLEFDKSLSIHSFQSRDWLEDLEGKTTIELLPKRVNFSQFPSSKYLVHLSKE